jgi:hypothetical protein
LVLPKQGSALDAVRWLESFCEVRVKDNGSLEFDVRQPSAIGLPGLDDRPHRCDFHLSPDSLEDYEEFGFPGFDHPPAASLVLGVYCSGPVNHRILGHLALFLSAPERYDALIDFNGLLKGSLAESRALVSSIPGRIWELPYSTGEDSRWYSHVGDRAFLTAWLDHPEFQMIK